MPLPIPILVLPPQTTSYAFPALLGVFPYGTRNQLYSLWASLVLVGVCLSLFRALLPGRFILILVYLNMEYETSAGRTWTKN